MFYLCSKLGTCGSSIPDDSRTISYRITLWREQTLYHLVAGFIFFYAGHGHYLAIFSPSVCVLPAVHMGYLRNQYSLGFSDYQLAGGLPSTGIR